MAPNALFAALALVLTQLDGGAQGADLPAVLARHRQAMGGDRALALLQRWRLTSRVSMYGLNGTAVEVADGNERRSEATFPALPYTSLDVWDGTRLIEQGTNGDVRQLSGSDLEQKRTEVALTSLDYLRPGTTAKVELLSSVEDNGHFDRLRVTALGGQAFELWLDAEGLTRKTITTAEGVVSTTTLDAYGQYNGIPLPKRTQSTTSTDTNVTTAETLKVEFPAALPKSLFAAPTPRLDATFPKGVDSVTVPLALWKGRYVMVQARLSGHLGNFILDTGASSTVYDFGFLKKVGAHPKGEIAQAAGLFKGISFVRVGALEFGEVRFSPQTVLAIDLHASDSIFPAQLDGILGYDFLSRFPITIDYVGGWLTFWKPGSYQPLPEEVPVDIQFVGTSVYVPVRVNGEEAGSFQLDTGNGGLCSIQHAALTKPLAAPKDHSVLYPHGLAFGSGAASAYLLHADLTVGSGAHAMTWKAAPLEELNLQDPKAATISGLGNIGNAWLRHFRFTMDYGAGKLYFLQRKPFRPADTYGDFGVKLKPNHGKLFVYDLAAGTSAAQAGLQLGDEVIDVDGVPALSLNNEQPDLLGQPVPGESHTLHVRRAGADVTATLTAAPVP